MSLRRLRPVTLPEDTEISTEEGVSPSPTVHTGCRGGRPRGVGPGPGPPRPSTAMHGGCSWGRRLHPSLSPSGQKHQRGQVTQAPPAPAVGSPSRVTQRLGPGWLLAALTPPSERAGCGFFPSWVPWHTVGAPKKLLEEELQRREQTDRQTPADAAQGEARPL